MYAVLLIIILCFKYTYQYYLDYVNRSKNTILKFLGNSTDIYLMWIIYLAIFSKNLFYPLIYLGKNFYLHYPFFITLFGVFLSFWAIFTLGSQYSDSIVIWQEHTLISDGPYILLNHPQRIGVTLELLGLLLLHVSLICVLCFAIFVFTQIRRSYSESIFLDKHI